MADLDPSDWNELRARAHAMLDDALDHVRDLRDGPVWQPMPDAIRGSFDEPIPVEPTDLATVHADYLARIAPYTGGNPHPRFFGWVQGGGTAVGMLAELLAASLDANVGGRDHSPIEVERQIVRWVRTLFGWPATASGILVTGTSLANWMAVVIAKTHVLGRATRARGLVAESRSLRAYTSAATHSCVVRAFEMSGLGSDALVVLPIGDDQRLDLHALRAAIARDRAAGNVPFMVIANAGTVDIGAIDDLAAVADLAAEENLWMHIDGAFGAFGMLAPNVRSRLLGLERADSIACDFHKWLQVPYDAGMLMVRDERIHADAFASSAAYLQRASRGMAAGAPWPTDFGPDLSRGFRALKVWFTLKTFGVRQLGEVIENTCALAARFGQQVVATPELELLAPVGLNIVCFRYRAADPDQLNSELVVELQESGIAAPSTTRVRGALAIRVAILNHRTTEADLDVLLEQVLAIGQRLANPR